MKKSNLPAPHAAAARLPEPAAGGAPQRPFQAAILKNLVCTALASLAISTSQAQSINFQWDSTQVFLTVDAARMAFADVDSDGDNDLLLTGQGAGPSAGNIQTSLFLNDGSGNFTLSPDADFTPLSGGSVIFFDADKDGDQDLFLNGSTHGGTYKSMLYFNDGNGKFTLSAGSDFVQVTGARCDVGDADMDGDMDLIITGNAGNSPSNPQHHTKLYLNNGQGVFTLAPMPFENLTFGAARFFDMDNDGDSDLVICGQDEQENPRTMIYENLANTGNATYVLSGNAVDGFVSCDLDAGDVDGDGDLDMLICGQTSNGFETKVFLNDGTGVFSELVGTPFPGVLVGIGRLVDFDNDGDLDALIGGASGGAGVITKVYENQGSSTFVESDDLFGYYLAGVAFADVNGDGKVDFVIGGTSTFSNPNSPFRAARLFLNETLVSGVSTPGEASLKGVTIYPNPARDFLFLDGEFDSHVIRLLGLDGKEVQSFYPNGVNKIDLSNVKAGIYVLEFRAKSSLRYVKVIVQK